MGDSSNGVAIYYWIPIDGDVETEPNVYMLPKRSRDQVVLLRDIVSTFPLPGKYLFRFKMAYSKVKASFVWIDAVDPDAPVPLYQGQIVAKVARLQAPRVTKTTNTINPANATTTSSSTTRGNHSSNIFQQGQSNTRMSHSSTMSSTNSSSSPTSSSSFSSQQRRGSFDDSDINRQSTHFQKTQQRRMQKQQAQPQGQHRNGSGSGVRQTSSVGNVHNNSQGANSTPPTSRASQESVGSQGSRVSQASDERGLDHKRRHSDDLLGLSSFGDVKQAHPSTTMSLPTTSNMKTTSTPKPFTSPKFQQHRSSMTTQSAKVVRTSRGKSNVTNFNLNGNFKF